MEASEGDSVEASISPAYLEVGIATKSDINHMVSVCQSMEHLTVERGEGEGDSRSVCITVNAPDNTLHNAVVYQAKPRSTGSWWDTAFDNRVIPGV